MFEKGEVSSITKLSKYISEGKSEALSYFKIDIYNITKAKSALSLVNSASTICPWVYAADALNN